MHDKSCSLKAEINREIRQDLIIENVILHVPLGFCLGMWMTSRHWLSNFLHLQTILISIEPLSIPNTNFPSFYSMEMMFNCREVQLRWGHSFFQVHWFIISHFHRCIYWPSFLTFSISSIFIRCPTFQKNLVTINMIGYGMFWQIQPQQLYEHWGKCHCSHIHSLDMNSRPTFVCCKETDYHPQVTLQWLNKLITWTHYVKKAAKDLKLQQAHPLLIFFGK